MSRKDGIEVIFSFETLISSPESVSRNSISSLNTADYSFGLDNITARAIDKASNIQETSILVTYEEDKIPGFQITYLFTGTLLGVAIIILLYVKRKTVRKYKEKN